MEIRRRGNRTACCYWQRHFLADSCYDPALLLARAYTETRPFDYRLPDAGYAPPRLTRGTGSVLGRPESLDQAALTIRRIVAAQPRSPYALALKGRLELLANEKEHDSAIQTLKSAAQLNEHNADALTDLAVAYAVRGDSEQRTRDYGQAMDLLLRALKEKPADPRIQYNLALVYEKLSMVDEAIETWHKFLGSHPSEGWRNEAISHSRQT